MKRAIVVGSGAGGAAAARVLAQEFQVTLLEAGGDFAPLKPSVKSFEQLRTAGAFVDPRMIHAVFPCMHVAKSVDQVHVWGSGLGGTTNLSTANALRYDGALKELGICLDEEFDELDELVPQSTAHRNRWPQLTKKCWDAFEALGFEPSVLPKMVDESRCCNCGKCVLGCKHGAKWTSMKLLDGISKEQLTVLKHHKVLRFETDESGKATGVLCSNRGKRVRLNADLIVLAAGGIGTPRILQNSGIVCNDTFFGDPVLCVAAPWENARMDRSLPMPFAAQRDGYILSPYFDYLSFFFEPGWREEPSNGILSLMIKLADDEIGSVTRRRIEKQLTEHDWEVLSYAVDDCIAIMEQLGVDPSTAFYGLVNEGHPGGTYPLTAKQAQSLHHDTLPENVYLADSTLLPSSMGNPPSLTIMALATKVAKACLEKHACG